MPSVPVRVIRVVREAADVLSFTLAAVEGGRLPSFTPGAHIDVQIAPGLTRPFSLCNGPEALDSYEIAVKKEVESRGGSAAMHLNVREGHILHISKPRNNFPLDEAAKHCLLLAGGIGVTPLLSMARHLQAARASFHLHYFSRSRSHVAFYDQLSSGALQRHATLHHALSPEDLEAFLGELLVDRPEGAQIYMCGPAPFMALVGKVASRTWPPDAIHLEHFKAAPEMRAHADASFEVLLARSGKTVAVPAGKTIVEALLAQGTRIDTSCEQGVCGTCVIDVVDGVPDHRDGYLSAKEKACGKHIVACVSRARSPVLVLDL